MGPQNHAVAVLHNRQSSELDVGQGHPLAVNLHPHPLEQGHLDAGHPDRDGPGPAVSNVIKLFGAFR